MWCLVGLGNPGPSYRRSRHNVGFEFIDHFGKVSGIQVSRHAALVEWGEGIWCDQHVTLSRPLTYMNRCGVGVQSLLSRQRAVPADLIVVHDDLDLALGRLKFKQRGGDGGHKGIRSIIETLGDDRFLRLRIGIGHPPLGMETSDYVLASFGKEEAEEIEQAIRLAVDAVETVLRDGLEQAMQRYHSTSENG